jgi:hypothetical protein
MTKEFQMKTDNPLDRHLSLVSRMPEGLRDAVTEVADELDLAWLATQAVFEDRATPELALSVLDRILARRSSLLSVTKPITQTDSDE